MVVFQLFVAAIIFMVVMGVLTVLAAVFGFRNAMRNLRRDASKTADDAEDGTVIFEARPCPHCGTYLSEPPQDGHCPACHKPV